MDTVVLRPITRADFGWLTDMAVDRDAVGEHNWSGPVDRAESMARLTAGFENDGLVAAERGRLVVALADGTPIGDVSWRTGQWGPTDGSRCPAIGIALLPAHRGRGYGTNAQRLLVQHLFDTYGVHRVQSDTAVDNVAEQKALERAGFVREGIVRDAEERDGRYHDHILYGVLRREWGAPEG